MRFITTGLNICLLNSNGENHKRERENERERRERREREFNVVEYSPLTFYIYSSYYKDQIVLMFVNIEEQNTCALCCFKKFKVRKMFWQQIFKTLCFIIAIAVFALTRTVLFYIPSEILKMLIKLFMYVKKTHRFDFFSLARKVNHLEIIITQEALN